MALTVFIESIHQKQQKQKHGICQKQTRKNIDFSSLLFRLKILGDILSFDSILYFHTKKYYQKKTSRKNNCPYHSVIYKAA